ncbi:MAG TPA: hypothetical protein VF379_05390 [Gaiellaceae bacterium]
MNRVELEAVDPPGSIKDTINTTPSCPGYLGQGCTLQSTSKGARSTAVRHLIVIDWLPTDGWPRTAR